MLDIAVDQQDLVQAGELKYADDRRIAEGKAQLPAAGIDLCPGRLALGYGVPSWSWMLSGLMLFSDCSQLHCGQW